MGGPRIAGDIAHIRGVKTAFGKGQTRLFKDAGARFMRPRLRWGPPGPGRWFVTLQGKIP